jgi:hypothetical protein
VDETLELEKTLDSTEMQPAADWIEHRRDFWDVL